MLKDFWEKNSITELPLKAFFKICSDAQWHTPHDVISDFGPDNVDVIGNNRYVIDVKGNNIRVVLTIRFEMGRIFCRWVGWHKDYEKIDASTI